MTFANSMVRRITFFNVSQPPLPSCIVLTSKNVTPAHREATLKLMSKYNLGKPPVFSQVPSIRVIDFPSHLNSKPMAGESGIRTDGV